MGAVVAIILMKEREMIDAFKRAHATSPDSARAIDDVGVDAHGVGMRRLRDREIVREASPGRFYLDEGVWEATQRTRQRGMLVMLVIIALVVGVFGVAVSKAH